MSLTNIAIIGVSPHQYIYLKSNFNQATGNIGKIILNALITSNLPLTITLLTRHEPPPTPTLPPNITLTIQQTDFSSSLIAAFTGKDTIISAVGATAFTEQQKYIDAAVHAGVKRFIPSEFSGLGNGFLGFDIPNRTAVIWDGGEKSFTLTNEKQLGQGVVSVLLHPERTANQYLYIASVETTQKEILSSLENTTNAKWTVIETTTEAEVSGGLKKLGEGDFSGAFALVKATVFGNTPGLRSNYVQEEKLGNGLLGLEVESVNGAVKLFK
ncbi:hypothetical protein MW887_006680 [Aspergillus wentii]|nr:hypothetical protein MW887_006680 [Aspergillus wentii]